jgi:hypothetical protein
MTELERAKDLLGKALGELEEHNNEYHHSTSKGFLRVIRDFIANSDGKPKCGMCEKNPEGNGSCPYQAEINDREVSCNCYAVEIGYEVLRDKGAMAGLDEDERRTGFYKGSLYKSL